MYAKCVFQTDKIIQYESEPVIIGFEHAETTNRHFNVARPQYPRPKTSQVIAPNGLVFYESASSGDWDFNQMANAVGGSRWCVCYYGDSKKR